jgi:hypothetical protein
MDIKFIIYIITGILIILLSSITIFKISKDKQNIFSRNIFIAILVITIFALCYYLITRNQQKEPKECEESEKCEENIFQNLPPEQTKQTIKELMQFIGEKIGTKYGMPWLKKCYRDDDNVDLLFHTCPHYKLTLEQLNKDLIEEMKNSEANPKDMRYINDWYQYLQNICLVNQAKYT